MSLNNDGYLVIADHWEGQEFDRHLKRWSGLGLDGRQSPGEIKAGRSWWGTARDWVPRLGAFTQRQNRYSAPYALRCPTASTTHSAVMLTIRRTVADGVSTCTGLAQPSRIGPIAMPLPAAVLSRL